MKKAFLALVILVSLLLTACTAESPYIGENGNWWIGEEDLGVPAQGPQGLPGVAGAQGIPGAAGSKGDEGEKGIPGKDGKSVTVTSVKKTGTEGAIDTYTIYFSDGSSTVFTVTNGTDGKTITIISVDKINSVGLIDTYKVMFSDNSSHIFTVKNGEDGESVTVASIGKTNSVGLIDTYEIVFSDGSISTFSVTNGRDGNTPYIGSNGNWWIGDEDTGVSADAQNMDRVGTDGLIFRMTIRGGVAGYEVCGYNGMETDIIIPNYIFGMPVVSIMQDALPNGITSISISSNTAYLPEFEDYTTLVSFDFNNAPISELPPRMFCDCSALKKVENYGNIEVISNYAFYGTKVVNLDFSNVVTIGPYAFGNCNFTGFEKESEAPKLFVYIPENVKEIGVSAFDGEIAVYYAGSTCAYKDELLYLNVERTDTGYYYFENSGSITLVNYDGADSRITIPETIANKPVTELADCAFYGNPYIERVEIPDSVKTIGEATFSGCKHLYGVFVPSSVECCGEFEGLTSNQSYGFENTTVFFEATTFDYHGGVTSPADLDLSKYMTGIKPGDIIDDASCVYLKKTASYEVVTVKNKAGAVTIPAIVNGLPVSRINTYALYGNTLTKVVHISDGIEKISTKAFYSSSTLFAVNIPKSVEAVNYTGFYSLNNCAVYVEGETIPSDWDSSWYSGIARYWLNSQGEFSADESYYYEIIDGKLYLVRYLNTVAPKTPIIIPEKIDGKMVYGIRSYCFEGKQSNSSNNRYIFVVPDTITVMESSAIYLYNYGYSYLYLEFASASDIPSTWSSGWAYGSYGYTSSTSSSYLTRYYVDSWELIDNIPTAKS